MKKIIILHIFMVMIIGLIFEFKSDAQPAVSYTPSSTLRACLRSPIAPVKIEGRQLLVFDGCHYKPYLIKGVGYSPTPVGRHVSDWGYPDPADTRPDNIFDDPAILNRDFVFLQAMNANTIRIFKGDDTEVTLADILDPTSIWYQDFTALGRFPNHITQQTLDLADSYGLKVIAGFWMPYPGDAFCSGGVPGYNYVSDYTSPTLRQDVLDRFEDYVAAFKDHPAILFWAIGNEENLQLNENDSTQIQAYYSLVNEMAQKAKQIEGSQSHPVALVSGDLKFLGDDFLGASDAKLNHVDIGGVNVYRGSSFGTLFSDFAALSNKPLWFSEFGTDSWHVTDLTDPNQGFIDETAQANRVGGLWDEIANPPIDVTIGGTVFEYSDEWWKPYEFICGVSSDLCNSIQNHFGFGPSDTSCPPDGIIDFYPDPPDNHATEEWFGIMSIAPNPILYTEDLLTPKEVYFTLQGKF